MLSSVFEKPPSRSLRGDFALSLGAAAAVFGSVMTFLRPPGKRQPAGSVPEDRALCGSENRLQRFVGCPVARISAVVDGAIGRVRLDTLAIAGQGANTL